MTSDIKQARQNDGMTRGALSLPVLADNRDLLPGAPNEASSIEDLAEHWAAVVTNRYTFY